MMRALALTLALVAVAGAVAGCRGRYTFPCDLDTQCVRDGARGYCVASPVDDKRYCEFPDQYCPSFRWDQTAPSAIAGVCVGEEKLDMGAGGGGPNDLAAPVISDFAFGGDAAITVTGCSAPSIALLGVWGPSTDDIWAVGQASTIFHYRAGMPCEVQTAPGTPRDLRNVWGRAATDVYIVGEAGFIGHSTNRGATWVNGSGQMADRGFWGIGGTASTTFAAVENVSLTPSGGEIWVSTGGSWSKLAFNPPDGSPLDTVWSNGTRVWTAGGGNIYYSDDGGNSWPISKSGTGVSGYWSAIGGPSSSTLVAVAGAAIYYFNGASWSTPLDHNNSGPCGGGFNGLGVAPGRAIAVGKAGCVASSTDGGATWKAYDMASGSPYTVDFNAAWIDATSGRTMVVGNGGTVVVDPMLPP